MHPLSKASTALAGASLVAITQIVTTELDCALKAAVWIFALCLPLLTLTAIKPPVERLNIDVDQFTPEERTGFTMFLCVALCDILGFAFVFLHFGPIPTLIFVASVIFALSRWTNWRTAWGLAGFLVIVPFVHLKKRFGKRRGRAQKAP